MSQAESFDDPWPPLRVVFGPDLDENAVHGTDDPNDPYRYLRYQRQLADAYANSHYKRRVDNSHYRKRENRDNRHQYAYALTPTGIIAVMVALAFISVLVLVAGFFVLVYTINFVVDIMIDGMLFLVDFAL